MLIDMIIGILCDFIPVMILMIYHYRNFKDKRTISFNGDSMQRDIYQVEDYMEDVVLAESKEVTQADRNFDMHTIREEDGESGSYHSKQIILRANEKEMR